MDFLWFIFICYFIFTELIPDPDVPESNAGDFLASDYGDDGGFGE